MKNTKTQNNKFKVTLIWLVLALVSFAALLTEFFGVLPILATSADAKTQGDAWKTYAANYTRPTPEYTHVVKMDDMYAELTSGVDGIIATTTTTTKPIKYINKNGATPYNYVITIENPRELLEFSFFTNNLFVFSQESASLGGITTILQDFFRNANVKLINNIYYDGKVKMQQADGTTKEIKQYIETQNGTTYTAPTGLTSNAVPDGYVLKYPDGSTSVELTGKVPLPIAPIAEFGGVFDGQNFEIRNLSVLRNSHFGTSATIDAMFSSVAEGGVVTSFGITDLNFVTTTDSRFTTATTNTLSTIVGANAGSVDHVYCAGFTNEAGNAYTPVATTGTALTQSYSSQWKTLTAEEFTALGLDARWYRTDGTTLKDKVPNAFVSHNGTATNLPRLNGLNNTADNNYEIKTTADFIFFSQAVMEGFGAATNVKILNDLDFTYVSPLAYIPADDLGHVEKITLYSSDAATATTTATTTLAERKNIYNLKLSAYLQTDTNKKNFSCASYGIFSSVLHVYTSVITTVANINFIDCDVIIPSRVINATPPVTSAGLISGFSSHPMVIIGVSSNGSVKGAAQSFSVGGSLQRGGFVGMVGHAPSDSVNGLLNVKNSSFSGTISGDVVEHKVHTNSAQYAHWTTGGIVGYMDTGDTSGMNFSSVYVGGNITGAFPKSGVSNYMVSNISVGGIVGFAPAQWNSTTSAYQGVWVDAGISSFSTGITVSPKVGTVNVNIGGLVGAQSSSAGNGDMNISGAISVKVAGNINIVSNMTIAKSNPVEFTYNVGGLAGTSGKTTFSSFNVSEVFSGAFINTADASNAYESSSNLNLGNLVGYLGAYGDNPAYAGKISGITNDKPLSITSRYSSCRVGGLVGNAYTNSNADLEKRIYENNTNTAAIKLNAGRSGGFVSGLGGTGGEYTNCKNSGAVTLEITEFNGIFSELGASGVAYGWDAGKMPTFTGCVNSGAVKVLAKPSANSDIDMSAAINAGKAQIVVAGIAKWGNFERCSTLASSNVSFTVETNSVNFKGKYDTYVIVSGLGGARENSAVTRSATANNCVNNGAVAVSGKIHRNKETIVYDLEVYVSGIMFKGKVTNSQNYGSISGNIDDVGKNNDDKARILAVHGIMYEGTAEGCVNGKAGDTVANLAASGAQNTFVGGIAGGDSVISNCKNYRALTVPNVGVIFAVGGIASTAKTLTSNENHGAVSFTGGASGQTYAIGGIVGKLYGGSTATKNVNYGAISASAVTTPLSPNIGGIVGQGEGNGTVTIDSCINSGALNVALDETRGRVGGIIASSIGAVTVTGGVNNGIITATAKSVGGILGAATSQSSGVSVSLADCFNIANIVAANSSFGGGICGALAPSNGTMYLKNCVNNAAVSGINAGGLAGATSGNGTVTLDSSLNYGQIAGSISGGGILGKASGATTNINGAASYGAITTGVGGGILGTLDSGKTANITSAISYVTPTSLSTIVNTNNGTLNLKMVISVTENNNAKTIGGGSGSVPTKQHVYTTSTLVTDTVATKKTLTELYALTGFTLSPNDEKLTGGYYGGVEDTTTPTLVWSEKPYKNNNVSHAGALTDTNCFALTTATGRRAGLYVGDNYNAATIDATDAVNATAIKAKLAECKQIIHSRDTFFNYYNGANIGDVILVDGAKTGDANRILPQASLQKDKDSGLWSFSTVILPNSPYYENNIKGKTSFTLNGTDIFIRDYIAMRDSWFSKNSSLLGIGADGKFTSGTFSSVTIESTAPTGENPRLALSSTFTVYQGAYPPAGTSDADLAKWKALYAREYKFSVLYYWNKPRIEMGQKDTDFTLTQKAETPINLDHAGIVNGNTTTYSAKIGNNWQSFSWQKSELSATFACSGIERTVIEGSATTIELWGKNGNTYEKYNISNSFEITKTINTWESTQVEGIPVPSGNFTIKLYLTDYTKYFEVPNNKYKLILTTKAGEVTFIREIMLQKEASGDTLLHYGQNLATDLPAYAALSDMSKITSIDANDSKMFDMGKVNFTNGVIVDGIGNVKLPIINLNENYYGALPSFGKINPTGGAADTDFNALAFYRNATGTDTILRASPYASVSKPTLTINQNTTDRTLYSFTYSFIITAQNKTAKATYSQTFNITQKPTGARQLFDTQTPPQTVTPGAEIAKGAAFNFTAAHAYTTYLTTNPINTKSVDVYYKADSAATSEKLLGTVTVQKPLSGEKDKIKMPTVSLDIGGKTTISFAVKTSGGVYIFKPKFQYKTVFTPPTSLAALIKINPTTAAPAGETSLTLAEFTDGGQNYNMAKAASRNAYIKDMTFSSSIPGGGKDLAYIKAKGSTGAITETLTEIAPSSMAGADTKFMYSTYCINPNIAGNKFFDELTTHKFKFIANFAKDTKDDYNSYVSFKLLPLAKHNTAITDPAAVGYNMYNDEDTRIYIMTKNADGAWTESAQPLELIPHYETDGTTVAYYTCEMYLQEDSTAKIKVYAGNPSYNNEYEIQSDGPRRNKTFSITIEAPSSASGLTFIVSLRLLSGSNYVRSTNIRFGTNGGTGDTEATIVDGKYTKTYTTTRNQAGIYDVDVWCKKDGYLAHYSTVTISDPVSLPGTPDLIFDSTTNANRFQVTRDAAATVTMTIQITAGNINYPWGDHVYA